MNQPVFMRCKEQAKQSVVECIEVHDSEGEWSGRGCERAPSQSRCLVRSQAALFFFRSGLRGKRVHSEDYVEDPVI